MANVRDLHHGRSASQPNIEVLCESDAGPRSGWVWSPPDFEKWAIAAHAFTLFPPLPICIAGQRTPNAPPPTISNASLIARCVKRLLQRDPAGLVKRSQHLHDARSEFGCAMTTRVFSDAYRIVYGRKRGRPSKRL